MIAKEELELELATMLHSTVVAEMKGECAVARRCAVWWW